MLRIKKLGWGIAVLMAGLSTSASADAGGYAGVGLGKVMSITGSSGLAYKLYGGAQVHEFPISAKMGSIKLAIQGEYVNFGSYTNGFSWAGVGWSTTGKASGFGVSALGSWLAPVWGGDKLSVLVRVGGAQVKDTYTTTYSGGWITSGSSTHVGVSRGIGAEYHIIPMLGVSLMYDSYPGSFSLTNVSGVFHF